MTPDTDPSISLPPTPTAPAAPAVSTFDQISSTILAGLGVAAPIIGGIVPEAAPFIPLGLRAVATIINAYSAIHSVRPANITEAQWNQLLTSDALNTSGEELIRQARLRLTGSATPPVIQQ
jgi:hypothetical protein